MPSTIVRMTVRWKVPEGESHAITSALHQIMLGARQQRGCQTCSVAAEVTSGVSICLVEEWAEEEALRQELRSERFTWLASLIERSSEPPTIEFLLPEGPRGLEYAECARGQPLD